MTILGGMLGFIVAILSILAERASATLDRDDPRRAFLDRINTFTANLPWRSRQPSVANES
jgi:hypothetical protein